MAQDFAAHPAMLADILRQPAVLQGLFARRDAFLEVGRQALRPHPGGRLFAFGCGDGWFAARAAAALAPGRFAVALSAATSLDMLIGPGGPPRADDRAVAISMSGSVDRTNEAATALRAAGGLCVALTNEDGGALGRIASRVASLHVDDIAPFLTGTTRYSATVLAMMLLLDGAGGTGRTQGSDLRALLDDGLPAAIDAVGLACRAICPRLVEEGIGGVRVLGAGADWPTADYAAAKLVKLTTLPVWSGETEEFAHSQFWSARRSELVILLAGSPAAAVLAHNTADALRAAGMRSLAIETAGVPVPAATWRIALPASPPWLAPLLMPLPVQLFAYHLSRALGDDPDASQTADPGRFLAAQMLSRRCELQPA